jgi:hypothetical protein
VKLRGALKLRSTAKLRRALKLRREGEQGSPAPLFKST